MTSSRTTVVLGGLALLAVLAVLVFVVLPAFQVRQITHGMSGTGCGIGTKVIEFGSVKCLPPPGAPEEAP